MTGSQPAARDVAGSPPERLLAMRRDAYLLAVRVLGSVEGAEDVVQQAYLDAWRHIRAGSPPQDVRTWFLRVVANAAKMHRRTEVRRQRRDAAVRLPERTEAPPESELVSELRRALESLEERHRVALSLCYEQDMSHEDAAAVLEIPRQTLSHRVGEGLELLRKALARAGYTAAPAAVVGALAHTAPPVPAALAAALEKLVSGGAVAKGTGAAAASAAAKGGSAMKVILGVVLAVALAGTIGLMGPMGPMNSPPAAQGPMKIEHYALSGLRDYLDGPRREAAAPRQPSAAMDKDGNLYFVGLFKHGSALRCATVDGMMITIAGDDRWGSASALTEGPASCIPSMAFGGGIARPGPMVVVKGRPLAGEDHGCIYTRTRAGKGFSFYRIWKNKAKGDRWWCKTVNLPAPLDGKAPDYLSFADGKTYVCHDYSYYEWDEAANKLTCLLAAAEYADKYKDAKGRPVQPDGLVRGRDGAFYLLFYNQGPAEPAGRQGGIVFRLSADKSKSEPIVISVQGGLLDGPGTKTGYFCGPSFMSYVSPDMLILGAVDDGYLRRWKDGRVSSLCKDGEWRECKQGSDARPPFTKNPPDGVIWCARQWCLGEDSFYQIYHSGDESRFWRYSGVNFAKPSIGPKIGG